MAIHFIQSNPPIVAGPGNTMDYNFGLVQPFRLKFVYAAVPVNIPANVSLSGLIELNAQVFSGPMVAVIKLRYFSGLISNVTAGSVSFTSDLLDLPFPAGSVVLRITEDLYFTPEPDSIQATMAVET